MATFDSLNLSMYNADKQVTIPDGGVIVVHQYVNAAVVDEMIQNTIEMSKNGVVYDEVKMDINFFYNIIKNYTDLDVSEQTPEYVYDILHSNNLADDILAALPQNTYDRLYDYLMSNKYHYEKADANIAQKLREFIIELPDMINTLNYAMNNFNPEEYENIMQLVEKLNGDQPLDETGYTPQTNIENA